MEEEEETIEIQPIEDTNEDEGAEEAEETYSSGAVEQPSEETKDQNELLEETQDQKELPEETQDQKEPSEETQDQGQSGETSGEPSVDSDDDDWMWNEDDSEDRTKTSSKQMIREKSTTHLSSTSPDRMGMRRSRSTIIMPEGTQEGVRFMDQVRVYSKSDSDEEEKKDVASGTGDTVVTQIPLGEPLAPPENQMRASISNLMKSLLKRRSLDDSLERFPLHRAEGRMSFSTLGSVLSLNERLSFLTPSERVEELRKAFGDMSAMSLVSRFSNKDKAVNDVVRSLLPGLLESPSEGSFQEETHEDDAPSEPLIPDISPEPTEVLQMDNPMMEKFQQILKNHLLKQKEKLLEQIKSIEGDTKRAVEESKIVSDSVFREERFVQKQKQDADSFTASIQQMKEKRDDNENKLKQVNELYNETRERHKKCGIDDEKMKQERKNLSEMLSLLKAHVKQKELDVKTSQAISSNLATEKEQLATLKMKQDLLTWRMEKEIIRLSTELEESYKTCLEIQKETRCLEELSKKIEKDVEGLEAENRLLNASITQFYTCIKGRDSSKHMADEALKEAKNKKMLVDQSVESYKKSIKIEKETQFMLENQKRQLCEIMDYRRTQMQKVSEIKEARERKLPEMMNLIDLVKKRLSQAEMEKRTLLKELSKMDELVSGKHTEYQTMTRAFVDKMTATEHLKKDVNRVEMEIAKLSRLNKEMHAKILGSERALAQANLQVEKYKADLNSLDEKAVAIQKEMNDLEYDIRTTKTQKKKTRDRLNAVLYNIKMKQSQILKMIQAEGLKTAFHKSTAQKKVERIEEELKSCQELTERMSDVWFRLQNTIMRMKQENAKMSHDINVKRKHNLTMESCVMRNDKNIKTILHDTMAAKKEIAREKRAVDRWQNAYAKAQECNKKMTNHLFELENKLIGDLKEEESESVELEGDICCLRRELEEMSEEVKTLQHALLEAEKRWKLAAEAKERVDIEKNEGGEIATMRAEIHRMEVRYNQLKKAQEKLMADLEMSVVKRDRILDNAEAREIRSRTTGKHYSRQQINRKINEYKNKVNQLKRQLRETAKKRNEKVKQLRSAEHEQRMLSNDLDNLRKSLEQLDEEIREGQLHRHFCLEAIVNRQEKAKYVEDLKFGRYRYKYTEDELPDREEANSHNSYKLEVILQALEDEFPQLFLQIRQMDHTASLARRSSGSSQPDKISQNEGSIMTSQQ